MYITISSKDISTLILSPTSHYIRGAQTFCPKNQIIWELKIAQYKMYTKILDQGTKFGSGTTGLDHSALHYFIFRVSIDIDFSPRLTLVLKYSTYFPESLI